MTRCVVFDFDGVLVDSNAVKRQAYFDIFASLGHAAAATVDRVLAADVDSDRYELIRRMLAALPASGARAPAGRIDDLVNTYAERYNDICEEHAATCAEITGASETIGRLAASHPLYINSATPEAPLRRIVERRKWTPLFRDVLGRPRTKLENLHLVMGRENIGGADIVVVGDGRRDLDAARAVGARFVGVRNAFNDFEYGSLLLLDDLRPLPGLVDSAEAPAPFPSGG